MSLKKKLITTISMMCLTFVLLIVGVWAVKSTTFTVGGNISFTAKGINATISQGVLSSTGSWVTASDASIKMKEVVINTDKSEAQLQTEFASWQGLDLLFNESGDDVTITFTITNNSTNEDDYVSVNVTVNGGTMSNATASINTSSVKLAPSASQEFVITFSVTDKKVNASLTGFEIAFAMELVEELPVDASEVSYLTFSYNNTEMTASVTTFDDSVASVEIPQKIKYEGKVFTVTSIGDKAFNGCSGLTEITIPSSVTSMGTQVFYNCSALTSAIIREGVTSLGSYAFNDCDSLTTVIIDSELISSSLTSQTNPNDSKLINYATTIYIKTGLTVGSYVADTTNFPNVETITTGDYAVYTKYSK